MPLSAHASRRSQQRGKPREALLLVLRYGDVERRAGRGRRAMRLGRDACRELVATGTPAADVDRARRVELVLSDDGAVVTVLNAPREGSAR